MSTNSPIQGLVLKSTGSWYKIKLRNSDELVDARARGRLRTEGIKSTNPVAVGDIVSLECREGSEYWVNDVEERKNYIIRKATKLSKQTHIIAANIDQAFFMVTLVEPKLKLGFLDRLLVTAEAYGIPARILVNKIDLCTPGELEYLEELGAAYASIGYPMSLLSVKDQFGMKEVHELMKGKTTLISGTSGIGKSSLLNALDPDLEIKVTEVSDFNEKGRHTTTFAEMHVLAEDTNIIDTPGLRSFGFATLEAEELKDYFPEMVERSEGCKFHNCLHLNEPGCAVRQAYEASELPWFRYENYSVFYHELKEQNA